MNVRPSEATSNEPEIDLQELEEYAKLYVSADDAAALLGIDEALFSSRIEDQESAEAAVWRRGRAQAKLQVRQAQFAQIEKNATLAVHLGRELLGQGGADRTGPVTFLVDTGISRESA